MRRARQYRLLALFGLTIAALLIVWCLLAWMLQLRSLDVVLLAALGPLAVIVASLALIWRAWSIERKHRDCPPPFGFREVEG